MAWKDSLKHLLRRLTPARIAAVYTEPLRQAEAQAFRSYSQEGEDRILEHIFAGRTSGFYVDVGAHHPTRFSNTAHLHALGWRGMNIDAMPGSMAPFKTARPDDINLELAVAEEAQTLTYYMFNEPALNGFDPELAKERDALPDYHIEATREVQALPLRRILREHLPPGQAVDLLCVDVEGLDLSVLRSNDWEAFRPEVVLVESITGLPVERLPEDPVYAFLAGQGYMLVAKTTRDLFFRDARREQELGA
jgi:FkbM family methyltransferase